jgi:hypothetical protein
MNLNFENEAQLDAFLGQLVEDAKSSGEERQQNYVKIFVNRAAGTLGQFTILPILAKSIGSFYRKLSSVREWYGPSSLVNNDDGAAFYKILPKEFYGKLTPEQEKLYDDVIDAFKEADATGEFGFDGSGCLRVRSYSLFTGIVLGQRNMDQKDVEDNLNKAALFIYPSAAPVTALQGAITAKQATLKDNLKPWLLNYLNPSLTDRKGAIVVGFNPKTNGQPGYESTVNFEMNSEYSKVVPEGFTISEDQRDAVADPIRLFLGWMYDYDNNRYFNETAFRELLESLQISVRELTVGEQKGEREAEEAKLENKNGSADPMLNGQPIVPGVETPAAPAAPTATTQTKVNPFD